MEERNMQNDTIDLRELFIILKKNKVFILSISSFITLLSIIYIFMAKPVYQVQAMVEIGKIKEKSLADISDLKQKLSYIYGINSKKTRELPHVKAITIGKKSKSVFSISVVGYSNEEAVEYLKSIVKDIEKEYAEKINTYVDTQKELIILTQEDIKTDENNLKAIKNILMNYTKKVINITKSDAALAGIYTMQITQAQEQLLGLERHISALKTKKFNLDLSIAPLSIKNTNIIGNIEVLNKPIKPKKMLIVMIAFLTGLMFSIFLVFILEFFKNENTKDYR